LQQSIMNAVQRQGRGIPCAHDAGGF
jgi:hypothetical protein